MKLKEFDSGPNSLKKKKASSIKKSLPFWVLIGGFYSVILYFLGLFTAPNVHSSVDAMTVYVKQPLSIAKNKVSGTFSNPDHLYLDISHKNFQRLAYKRELALMMGRLISSDEDFVSADIRHDDTVTPVKIRLKGDFTDHLKDDKWSYRVKVKGDGVLYGMEEFSIQHPITRNYLAEWVFHEALKREGIIALRYDFVEVSVNGKNQGIFAIEEHFNATLIENNRRRAGPIIRLSEEQVWAQKDDIKANSPMGFLSSATFNASYLDPFESKAIAADSVYNQQFVRAISLFEAFRAGQLKTRDVFDIEKLANYLAISELMGAQHGLIWHNMRFYYNPVTGVLEPIGFDGNAGEESIILTAALHDFEDYRSKLRELFYYINQDPLFLEAYRKAMYRVSQPAYLETFYQDIGPDFRSKLQIIHKSFPEYTFPYDIIEHNRKLIYYVTSPKDGLRIQLQKQVGDTLFFQAGSTQSQSVRIHKLHTDSSGLIPFPDSPPLPGRKMNTGVEFKEIKLTIPRDLLITDSTLALYTVSYKVDGLDSLHFVPVLPYPHSDREIVENHQLSSNPTDRTFAFLSRDEENQIIVADPGAWTVDKNLIIPKGYALHLSAGTTLDLVQNAAIVVRGPVKFNGSPGMPIRVSSTDGTGQGLVVLNANGPSEITHAEFTGLSNLNQFGWDQTGSVTFHESDVSLSYVSFEHNRSEDALNIFRSSYQMDSVRFSHTFSDAFDGDFSNGIITNSVFEQLGNDGIDVSGSIVTLQNVQIQGAGDKAVSAGEFSKINGVDLEITQSEIAIASKDQSVVTLTGVHISNSRLGVTLFQKKPEFGPAAFEADDYTIENTEVPSLIEEGSLFMVNGERIPANQKNVSDLLYGNLYGTASN